jgi:predicted ATP-grasp superfamily ATP-dependent carboligase
MADRFLTHGELVDAVAAADFDRPPALVCNAHVTGLGVARALSRRGIPVVAVDRAGDGVAPPSAAVDLAGRVTYPLDDRAGFRADVEAIADAADRPPVAFACMDEWVHAFARTEPEGVVRPFGDRATVDAVLDKESLYGSAERLGVPYPETYRIAEATTADTRDNALPTLPAGEAADRLGFPLVVKPALKRRFEEAVGTNVVEVGDREAYRDLVERSREAGIRVLAQRKVDTETGEDRSLASYVPPGGVGSDGEGLVGVVGNAAVRYPRGYGTSCVVERTRSPTVRERAVSVLADAGYHGISEAEFVRDADRGDLLLDVNTRPWKWISMPVAAGQDLPLAAYADATGAVAYDPPTAAGADADDPDADPTTWVSLRDYLALLAEGGATPADRRALSRPDWRALVSGAFEDRPGLTTAVYRPSDPGPAAALVETEFSDREYYCAC